MTIENMRSELYSFKKAKEKMCSLSWFTNHYFQNCKLKGKK